MPQKKAPVAGIPFALTASILLFGASSAYVVLRGDSVAAPVVVAASVASAAEVVAPLKVDARPTPHTEKPPSSTPLPYFAGIQLDPSKLVHAQAVAVPGLLPARAAASKPVPAPAVPAAAVARPVPAAKVSPPQAPTHPAPKLAPEPVAAAPKLEPRAPTLAPLTAQPPKPEPRTPNPAPVTTAPTQPTPVKPAPVVSAPPLKESAKAPSGPPDTPSVVAANGGQAWVRLSDHRTVIVKKGQTVPGLGTFMGTEGGSPKFDDKVIPLKTNE